MIMTDASSLTVCLTKSNYPILKMPEVIDPKNNTIVVFGDHRIDKSSIIQGTYISIAGR